MSDDHPQIVIVRRHHADHDEHHGGVWKIAFADFMTAMMAFFLVMWLIAANDKTRATVARYFNPVKLVDATIRKQGLHDPKVDDANMAGSRDSESRGASKDNLPTNGPANETPEAREMRLDEKMRTSPLAALAEIAGSQRGADGPPKDTLNGAAPVIGRQGGPAFRDPFAPPPMPAKDADERDEDPLELLTPPAMPRSATPPGKGARTDAEKAREKPEDQTRQKIEAAVQDQTVETANAPPNMAPSKMAPPKIETLTAQKNDEDLTKLISSLKTPGHESEGPDIKVRRTNEGYLVSLTDTTSFSMFANASAVPSPRVVLMMERIAKALATKPGGVVIRGFTDNKPFRTGRYDNWNLSVDRAQAAHYMLVRGGLNDARIAGVEGFADRATGAGVDPGSPLNRRIEILVKDEAK